MKARETDQSSSISRLARFRIMNSDSAHLSMRMVIWFMFANFLWCSLVLALYHPIRFPQFTAAAAASSAAGCRNGYQEEYRSGDGADGIGNSKHTPGLSRYRDRSNERVFDPPYPYDLVYCGSPLYGRLNARRVQEWIMYHDMIFGERSHFVFYDAGGVHEEVRAVLLPWIELGRVSVEDIRSTTQFDGYYFNQFLMVNDCVHRNKFLANWTIFFDLDEYLYVQPPHTLQSLLAELYNKTGRYSVTEVSFSQFRMVEHLCHSAGVRAPRRVQPSSKQWAIEKLTYRDHSTANHDVKYVCNPRTVYSTGVHGIEHVERGEREYFNDTVVRYYHYHGMIDVEDERDLCKYLSEHTDAAHNFTQPPDSRGNGGDLVQSDDAMVPLALMAKQHEIEVLQKLFQLDGP